MHSYGEMVGSEAVREELSYTRRKAQELPGVGIYLFYYGAFSLDKNQSVLSAFGDSPNNDVKVIMLSTFIHINTKRSPARRTMLHLTGRRKAVR